jgi:hypothetical protein
MSLEMGGKVFAALAKEPDLRSIHIAGGEPMLRMDLLADIVRLARQTGMPLDYVETNAFWCTDRSNTRRQLDRLKQAGLPAVLVSVSMFHNEFVPFSRTRICAEAALEVFGPGNVILYLPHMYKLLSQMPDDGTHKLEQFCAWAGLADRLQHLPQLYDVIPAGRATEALRDCYTPRAAATFMGKSCEAQLLSTTHFHVDHHGNLFTGLCAGIVPARIDDLHPAILPDRHPIFCMLCEEGPYGLMRLAHEQFDYQEKEGGYISKCDLCFDVRRHLRARGKFNELLPDAFYRS